MAIIFRKKEIHRIFQFLHLFLEANISTMLDSIGSKKSALFSKKAGLTKEKSIRRCRPESSPPTRRAVSFAQTDNDMEAVTICPILPLSDLSKKEMHDTYYNENEFRIIKIAIVKILRKMIAGTYKHDIDCIESEARGLENKTPKGSKARKKNRYAALFAVLDEQNRQRERGLTVDSECIAKLYRQTSAKCQMKAIQIAAIDAKLVHGHQETIICEPEVSKKIVPPPASPTPSRRNLTCSIASPYKSRSSRRILSMMS